MSSSTNTNTPAVAAAAAAASANTAGENTAGENTAVENTGSTIQPSTKADLAKALAEVTRREQIVAKLVEETSPKRVFSNKENLKEAIRVSAARAAKIKTEEGLLETATRVLRLAIEAHTKALESAATTTSKALIAIEELSTETSFIVRSASRLKKGHKLVRVGKEWVEVKAEIATPVFYSSIGVDGRFKKKANAHSYTDEEVVKKYLASSALDHFKKMVQASRAPNCQCSHTMDFAARLLRDAKADFEKELSEEEIDDQRTEFEKLTENCRRYLFGVVVFKNKEETSRVVYLPKKELDDTGLDLLEHTACLELSAEQVYVRYNQGLGCTVPEGKKTKKTAKKKKSGPSEPRLVLQKRYDCVVEGKRCPTCAAAKKKANAHCLATFYPLTDPVCELLETNWDKVIPAENKKAINDVLKTKGCEQLANEFKTLDRKDFLRNVYKLRQDERCCGCVAKKYFNVKSTADVRGLWVYGHGLKKNWDKTPPKALAVDGKLVAMEHFQRDTQTFHRAKIASIIQHALKDKAARLESSGLHTNVRKAFAGYYPNEAVKYQNNCEEPTTRKLSRKRSNSGGEGNRSPKRPCRSGSGGSGSGGSGSGGSGIDNSIDNSSDNSIDNSIVSSRSPTPELTEQTAEQKRLESTLKILAQAFGDDKKKWVRIVNALKKKKTIEPVCKQLNIPTGLHWKSMRKNLKELVEQTLSETSESETSDGSSEFIARRIQQRV